MIAHLKKFVLPAAYALLPAPMASVEATRLLVAIGWQESRFEYRRQIGGPARGFWQFETAGIGGVLAHHKTRDLVRVVLTSMQYVHPPTPYGCHLAVEHNDTLAAVFARLLLWTDAAPLPKADEHERGWELYLRCWRPGKPHPMTWAQAWAVGVAA